MLLRASKPESRGWRRPDRPSLRPRGGGRAYSPGSDNTTTKQGTTVLLPNSLALSGDDGSTTTLA
ncbi:hypothetical protein ABZ589_25710, partial [Streptomyces sp. NPDC013313]|uniref:hypothetical protein n=1 Tax=Streptomyces sp. NPDC013313 TaxID=3155603 RepID=UPI0033CDFF50